MDTIPWMDRPANDLRSRSEIPSLDRTDFALLEHLQKNARLSNKELADRVGIAPSTCHTRVQRLHQSGAIRGSHAEVDPAAVGVFLQALIFIQLANHAGARIAEMRKRLLELREVAELYYLGGSQDLVVRVAVRDTDHLRQLVMEGISTDESVRHLETSIIFDHEKSPSLPEYREHPE